MEPQRIRLITTGGTIEKVYDEDSGELANRRSIVRRMLDELRLEDVEVDTVELMSKDSLDMTEEDRSRVVEAVREAFGGDGGDEDGLAASGGGLAPAEGKGKETGNRGDGPGRPAGIVILHGTDTLTRTGDRLLEAFPDPPVPVVLTGAMRPFEMKRSDALQNLTEALFASRALRPGIYCAAHGRALRFPGVRKDRRRGTFVGGS
ncbi:MAG: asparaginase domain-containing protein [bacterium]